MRRTALALVGLLVTTAPALTADPTHPRYYVLLFGGQADLRPQTAHTWATFVRVTPHPSGVKTIDNFTVSWLPVQMPVRPLKLRPSAGRNYGLHETLDIMNGGRPMLSLWGPYEISPEWYRSACEYKAVLDGGAVGFKTLDGGDRRGDLAHCVHAVVRTDPRLHYEADPIFWYGELITRRVANAMDRAGLLLGDGCTHDWLIPALGIEKYPLTRRRIGEPIVKFFRGPVGTTLSTVLPDRR